MKLKKFAIVAVVILGLSACTQRTCPTYALEDVQQEKTPTEVNA